MMTLVSLELSATSGEKGVAISRGGSPVVSRPSAFACSGSVKASVARPLLMSSHDPPLLKTLLFVLSPDPLLPCFPTAQELYRDVH